jgi:trehalose-6-phosphate synthase
MPIRADLILANRAYLDHESPRWADSPSAAGSGGLLAAVRPIIAPWDGSRGTTWIGAGLGRYDREWTDARGFEMLSTPKGHIRHRRLYFGSSTWAGHYGEVANSFLWPLVHLVREDLPKVTGYYPAPAPPTESDWASYLAVNTAFADAAAEETGAATAWVHDYQLTLVPRLLRERGFRGRIGFFLHTPVPSLEVAQPYLQGAAGEYFWDVIRGMLGADLVGLQSLNDLARFVAAATRLPDVTLERGGVRADGRFVRCSAYPVGIDVDDVLSVATSAGPPDRIRAAREAGLPLVVGLERGDFTKGIPERLRAMAAAYRAGARFAYVGIAAPTREGLRAYAALDAAIEREAARAQEAAYAAGCPFVNVRANVGWRDVVALQREADVVFTSSLADGQNLVPLQAAIAQSVRPARERGVIITGRDAGVASAYAGFEADGLATVDPLDEGQMVHTLTEALDGRPGRISERLIGEVRSRDALAWATRFLTDLEDAC